MTVSTTTSSAVYTGTGTTATYPYTWAIQAAGDLIVYRVAVGATAPALLTLGVDYSVTGVGIATGGNVVLTAGNLAAGVRLFMASDPAEIQQLLLTQGAAFNPSDVMNQLDQLTRMVQSLRRLSNGALQIPVSESLDAFTTTFPLKAGRASTYPFFDANGNLTTSPGTSNIAITSAMQPVVQAASLGAGRTAFGGLVTAVATVAALKALATTDLVGDVIVECYSVAGDGGGGVFRWSSADARTDNAGTIIQPNAGGTGRWNRLDIGNLVNVRWFGAKGDGATDDTVALVAAITYAKSLAHDFKLLIPAGRYLWNPNAGGLYVVDNSWRAAIEFVDVTRVVVEGYGATLVQNVPNTWKVNDPANHYMDEGIIQFRSSGNATCTDVVVVGLRIEMVKLGYLLANGDGNDFGVAFRGVVRGIIRDCYVSGAGTDGFYVGATYNDTFNGNRVRVAGCHAYNCNRCGLSVVGCDDVDLDGSIFELTGGGSFQAGVDIEADPSHTNSRVTVRGCHFIGNTTYGLGIIRSNDVVVVGNTFSEPTSTKAIGVDGDVQRLTISDNDIVHPSMGIDLPGSNLVDITIANNRIQLTGAPNYFIRQNIAGTATGCSRFTICDNSFDGESGILLNTISNHCRVLRNTHLCRIINGSTADTNVFTWSVSACPNLEFNDNRIDIDATCTWGGTKSVDLSAGSARGNVFNGVSTAVAICPARTGGRTIEWGFNRWSTYFYYNESYSTNFDIKGPGAAIAYDGDGFTGGGSSGARIVNGGFARTSNANAANANLVGDVTYLWSTSSGNPLAYRCTVAGTPGTWVGLWNKT